MNLRQLHYFCEVATEGSAAHAAKKLFVAPTAISMSLSQLEAELGGQLFDRSARPMPLTPLGRFLLPRALELLGQVQRLEGDAKRVASAHQRWLGIGFTRSVMMSMLPSAVRRFHSNFPGVRLQMVELLSEYQPSEIQAGKVHVGISRFVDPIEPPPGFTARKLFEEKLLAALPSGQAEQGANPISLEELARHPFISYPRDPKARYAMQVLAAAERRGASLMVEHGAMEIHTALGLVAAGFGATLVGASVALQARSGVTFRRVKGFDATSTVVAIIPDADRNEFVEPFVELLAQAAADMVVASHQSTVPARGRRSAGRKSKQALIWIPR
jgi:DNA-binding transcriptional LysR family regulator